MVTKKKSKGKSSKNKVADDSEDENNEGGMDADDALAGLDEDKDIVSGESKPRKIKKKKKEEDEDLEEELDEVEGELEQMQKAINGGEEQGEISIKASKPIGKIKKGDKIWIDNNQYEVDAHTILIDHGSTKEMAIELFDDNDKDYQLRYFSDQVESTMQFYELQEIMYFRKVVKKIEW